jgi:hypothetical protein
MPAATLGWLRTLLAWAAGPWLCGYCAALALTLARALVAGRPSDGGVDLRPHGTLWVAARGHLTAALVAAVVATAILAVAVSRAMGRVV